MEPAGQAISPWESKPSPSTPGGISCKATASSSRKRWRGREEVDPFTFVIRLGIQWNWSRLGYGDCRAGGDSIKESLRITDERWADRILCIVVFGGFLSVALWALTTQMQPVT